jgi:hypothetical protein
MFIPDPGSEFFPSRIQGQKGSPASKNGGILTQKIVSKLLEMGPGCSAGSSQIRIPDQKVKNAPDPQFYFFKQKFVQLLMYETCVWDLHTDHVILLVERER